MSSLQSGGGVGTNRSFLQPAATAGPVGSCFPKREILKPSCVHHVAHAPSGLSVQPNAAAQVVSLMQPEMSCDVVPM